MLGHLFCDVRIDPARQSKTKLVNSIYVSFFLFFTGQFRDLIVIMQKGFHFFFFFAVTKNKNAKAWGGGEIENDLHSDGWKQEKRYEGWRNDNDYSVSSAGYRRLIDE